MNNHYYYQKRAEEHQREISKELATRHLLDDANPKPLTVKPVRRQVFRIAPAAIAIAILLMLNFLR